jgi:hypothetical protein
VESAYTLRMDGGGSSSDGSGVEEGSAIRIVEPRAFRNSSIFAQIVSISPASTEK